MSITIFVIGILGTLPILIVWFKGNKKLLPIAIILSLLIAVGIGNPKYGVIDLVFVGIIGYLAYSNMHDN